MAAMIAGPSHH